MAERVPMVTTAIADTVLITRDLVDAETRAGPRHVEMLHVAGYL